ncbi:V-type ATP synthase subunit E [Halorubellus sp. JP-L1]|uniref:V-type ATP synthase subunit E n=1 Tax=Halorubellus sp. JP-L1 TaxID=2715753 RepID=UPI0014096DDD|nr:V-type ATP synthase subunit E [Halorubellus sp. JP-L1]NHN41865.1 V-type ATP synthase subunit E [Halorubellus sp. JP-L1]
MSLDTVVEDIRDEARARAEEIRADGDERADEIVEQAETDAEETIEEAERAAERTVEQEREQKLSSAKLEAKQMRLEARRDVLQDVRERVESELATMEGEQRTELTTALLDAASVEFDDGAAVSVYGREDDQELLEDVVADYDGYAVAGTHECLGGVVVEAEESRVRVNNTFDSLLEDVWEDNLKEISNQLFEEEE